MAVGVSLHSVCYTWAAALLAGHPLLRGGGAGSWARLSRGVPLPEAQQQAACAAGGLLCSRAASDCRMTGWQGAQRPVRVLAGHQRGGAGTGPWGAPLLSGQLRASPLPGALLSSGGQGLLCLGCVLGELPSPSVHRVASSGLRPCSVRWHSGPWAQALHWEAATAALPKCEVCRPQASCWGPCWKPAPRSPGSLSPAWDPRPPGVWRHLIISFPYRWLSGVCYCASWSSFSLALQPQLPWQLAVQKLLRSPL